MKNTCKMKFFIIGLFFLLNIARIASISPALILTPLLKNNHTALARNASAVDPRLFLNVTSHSGFLTVDERYNSNIFFWYFPVSDKPVEDNPWIIWLQGGPGASSIAGLFDEIGPFEYADRKLKLRESSWTGSYSVLFIDNPVGAGFSFTNSEDGFVRDMSTCATHLYKVLQQFTFMFPELRSAPLYLAGESYAGRYLPALALSILHQDPALGPLDVNMQGIMMGNPVLNRDVISDYRGYFQQWGLIDSQGAQAVKPIQDAFNKAIREKDSDTAVDLRNQLLDRLDDMAMQQQNFNLLEDDLQKRIKVFVDYITLPEVRAALHTGSIRFTFSNGTVNDKLKGDFISEVPKDMAQLLEHYRILIYWVCRFPHDVFLHGLRALTWIDNSKQTTVSDINKVIVAVALPQALLAILNGQLDLTAPCVPNAQDRRRKWHWSQRDYFLKAPRTPWWYNNSVAGYVKSGGGLTEVLIRGAGHLVPIDKPAQLLKLVNFFIRGLDMPYPPNYLVGVNNTPEYKMPLDTQPETLSLESMVQAESDSSATKVAMIVSIFINVILVLGILAAVVYNLRLKHRVQLFSYNNMEETSINDGVLSMS